MDTVAQVNIKHTFGCRFVNGIGQWRPLFFIAMLLLLLKPIQEQALTLLSCPSLQKYANSLFCLNVLGALTIDPHFFLALNPPVAAPSSLCSRCYHNR